MATSHSGHLPPELRSGYVYDQILRTVADTPNDEDRLPDGIAAQGRVTFTPVDPLMQINSSGRGVHLTKEPVTCTIDSGGSDPSMTGKLVDPAGVPGGVWLPVGRWRVNYNFDDWGTSIPSFTFTVTEEYTGDSPLDLALASEIKPRPNTKFVVNEQVYMDALEARNRAEVASDDAYAFREETREFRDETEVLRNETLSAADAVANVHVSNVAPENPRLGDIWFDTSGA